LNTAFNVIDRIDPLSDNYIKGSKLRLENEYKRVRFVLEKKKQNEPIYYDKSANNFLRPYKVKDINANDNIIIIDNKISASSTRSPLFSLRGV